MDNAPAVETPDTETSGTETSGTRTSNAATAGRPATVIPAAREVIDDLDRRIIALLRQRAETSAQVQRARIAAGGRRLELSREMDILQRYRDALGEPGRSVAMSVLEYCRGRA